MSNEQGPKSEASSRLADIAATRLVLAEFGVQGAAVIIDGGCEGDMRYTGAEYLAMIGQTALPLDPTN